LIIPKGNKKLTDFRVPLVHIETIETKETIETLSTPNFFPLFTLETFPAADD
jgi:hypothetical protein